MSMVKKAISALLVALVVSLMTAVTVFAASEFEGVWTVKAKDVAFDITLSADGKASTTDPKAISGTWTEDGGAAIIKWENGRSTKIAKDGDHYAAQGTKKDGSPGNTTGAVKKP